MARIAPAVLGHSVLRPTPGEYVADGAARQAAGVLLGSFPEWQTARTAVVTAAPTPNVLARYRAAAGG